MDILHAGLTAAVAKWKNQDDWLPYNWQVEVADAKTSLEEFNLNPGTYALTIALGEHVTVAGRISTRVNHREVYATWEIGDMSNTVALAPQASRLLDYAVDQDRLEPAAAPKTVSLKYEAVSIPEGYRVRGKNVETRCYIVKATLDGRARSGYAWNVIRITEDGEVLEVAPQSSLEEALFGFIEQTQ